MDTFGKRLKSLIKKSDLKTIKVFSEKSGIHENTISRIVNDRHSPSFELIEACVSIFSDTEIIWLLTGRDFKSELELENKQLKEKVGFYQDKLGTIAKPFSNRMNPQRSFRPRATQTSINFV